MRPEAAWLYHTKLSPTGLHNLLREGCSSRVTCQLSEQGLLFNWEPVFLYSWCSNSIIRNKGVPLECMSSETCYSMRSNDDLTNLTQASSLFILKCSFLSRWRSVDGNDQACRSCDISHRAEEPLSTEPPQTTIGTKAWPSTSPPESRVQNRPEQKPATYFRFNPGTHQSRHTRQSSAGVMKRGADYKAGKYNRYCIYFTFCCCSLYLLWTNLTF